MTQEDKKLLLQDLSARLPYRVILQCCEIVGEQLYSIDDKGLINNDYDIEEVKPLLFPLSSMTGELWVKEFSGFGITRDFFEYGCELLEFNDGNPDLLNTVGFINQLIKNHFDIYGLIPMGLALDATGLGVY